MTAALFQKDFRLVMLSDQLDSAYRQGTSGRPGRFALLNAELGREPGAPAGELSAATLDDGRYRQAAGFLQARRTLYIKEYNRLRSARDSIQKALARRLGGRDAVSRLRENHANESLSDLVQNAGDFDAAIIHGNGILQRFRPVYMDSPGGRLRAPLYVSRKAVFGKYVDTFAVNTGILWLMTALLGLALYFDLLRKAVNGVERLFSGKRRRQ
jgi:hypothetical protein